MIGNVSFKSTSASYGSFADKIKQPQTFVAKEPVAASTITEGEKKKGSGGKKLAVIAALVAGIAGVAYGIKTGKIKISEELMGKITGAIGSVKTFGEGIINKLKGIGGQAAQ